LSPEEIINQSESRYHKIEHQPKEIEEVFVDIFLNSYDREPKEIILDLDVTNDPVYRNQWEVLAQGISFKVS
jgi:hypothetical protein